MVIYYFTLDYFSSLTATDRSNAPDILYAA